MQPAESVVRLHHRPWTSPKVNSGGVEEGVDNRPCASLALRAVELSGEIQGT